MSKSSRIIDALKTNTTYYFHVRAKNTLGRWSILSDTVNLTTSRDTTAPATPTNFVLTILTGVFLFNWTKASEVDVRGGGYKLYVYTSNTPGSAVLLKEIGYTSEWAIVGIGDKSNDASITITEGTEYWFWLTTIDASANESAKLASSPVSGTVKETAYGSCYGNEIAWSQASAVQNTWYIISDTDMSDGQLKDVTHDGSGKLTVAKAGKYQIVWAWSGADSANNDHMQVGIAKNGTVQNDGIQHFITTVAGQDLTTAGTAILNLAASDYIEIAVRTTDNNTPTLDTDHLNFIVVKVGSIQT